MALGSLIGSGFVRISADTDPAEKAIKALGAIGSQALTSTLLPAIAPVVVGVGAIATSFIGAGAAAGAFAAAVKPQFAAITDASKQYAAITTAQSKADLAAADAKKQATKSGVAYEDALKQASDAHQKAQALAATGAKGYSAAQKEATEATAKAQSLATTGGKAYVKALADQKAAQDKVKDAQAAYNQTLAGLPPATRATAVAYAGLTDSFKKWSDSLSGSTMPVFTIGIEKLQGLLPKLTPIVKTASGVIQSFVENIGAGTGGQVFSKFGKDISGLAGGALSDFLNIGRNLAIGFAGILDSFTPMAAGVTGGLTKLTAKFAEWGATASSTGGVQKFFALAKEDAPKVGAAFEQIATALTHVGGGLGPLTGIGLKVAETLAKILSALPVPVLNQVVNAIVAINLAMKAYALYTSIAAGVTWLASTAFWALAAAILANPITWIVIGIVALVAAIVLIATKTTWFQTAWKATWGFVKNIWDEVYGFLTHGLGQFALLILGPLAPLAYLALHWKQAWADIQTAAVDTWNFLDKWVIKPLATAFMWLWTNGIQPAIRFIVQGFLAMVGSILRGATDMFGWIPGIGPKLKTASKAFDSFADSVNKSLGGIKAKTVPVTVSFNGVPEGKISGHTYTSTTGFTYAGGGAVRGPGTETSDDIPARLSDNEHVWTAKEVRAAGGHFAVARLRKQVLKAAGFAGGGPVTGRHGLAMSYTLPTDAGVQAGMRGAVLDNVTPVVKSITSAYAKAFNAALTSIGGQIPSGQHLAVIKAAMAAAHVPPPGTTGDWYSGLNTLITRESGWNASAVNRTDINAQLGHPSQGLAQTIPSTFDHYVPAGLRSLGILNPVANVAAAIRYIVSRYGSITRVQQANANLPAQGYDSGGWLMPGATIAVNKTGRPERVVGPHEAAGVTINLTVVNQGVIGSQRDTMNWLVASLQQAKRENRLRGIIPTGP